MVKNQSVTETYSDTETERRMNAAVKRALNTPHKPHATKKSRQSKKAKPKSAARKP